MAPLVQATGACENCKGGGCPDGACLPPGGLTGYVLTKFSDGDFAAAWEPGGGGGGGGATTMTVVAAQNITAFKVVGLNPSGQAYLVDSSVLADQYVVAGISMFAANVGEPLDIITDGLLPTGSLWVVGPKFLGTAGILTDTPPTSGFYLQVASAPTTSELIVRPQTPITRA